MSVKNRSASKRNSQLPAQAALKLKPAAEYLGGLSKPTMYRLVERGLLKPCRATRHLLFPIAELERFLRE
jgi:excisionase family DNA binding protein